MPFNPPHSTRARRRAAALGMLLVASLALVGCGGMSGTYEAKNNEGKIEFKGDRAYVSITPAPTMVGEYEVDGDKVIVKVNEQSMVLTRRGDTLEGGPFGMTFVKK